MKRKKNILNFFSSCLMIKNRINLSQKLKASFHLVKVHGGTTTEEIVGHVRTAQDLARANSRHCSGIFTVLFFDEANSTEAIGTIKWIMCDRRMNGYHVGLQSESMRNKYLDGIAALFKSRRITRSFMDREINACYEVFLDEIQLPNAIARNQVIVWLVLAFEIALFLIIFF